MKEARELQTHIDELNNYIKIQDARIDSMQLKMRGALSALQTGTALDVVAAIEILRRGNET
jgi:hypothetical protein